MNKLLLITLFLLAGISGWGRDFDKAIGFRFSGNSGFYYDQLNKDLSSTRIQVGWRENGTQATVMKIFRRYNLDQLPDNFSFFYGYGAHAGYIRWNQYYPNVEDVGTYWRERYAPVFGLDGICGLSYNIKRMPVAINLEVKPYFDFWGRKYYNLNIFDFSLSVEYNF